MGWTSYNAKFYKQNGEIDRKAEIDDMFARPNSNKVSYKVLKSAMVGSVYYGAIERCELQTNQQIKREVFGLVVLTKVNMKDYYNFYYKEISEDCGPAEAKCPINILKLLTESDNENAVAWRNRCYAYHEERKSDDSLSNLPIGSCIRTNINGKTYDLVKRGPNQQFKRCWWFCPSEVRYVKVKNITEYTVISRGAVVPKVC